jgi:hypothetical protein
LESNLEPTQGIIGIILAAFFLILLSLTAVLVALSFPTGIYAVFFTHLSFVFFIHHGLLRSSTAATLGYPFLWLGPVPIVIPIQVTYGAAFLAVLAIYVAMFILAVFQGRSLPYAVKSGLKNGIGEFLSNRALLTLVAIGFLVFTAAMIDEFVSAVGPPIGNPFSGGNSLVTFIGFTLAPLREEFGFRVLLIGLAALIVTLPRPESSALTTLKSALRTLWRPSVAYEGIGNNTFTLVVIWAAGALSAGTFGACHVACGGGGWDIGKLPEAIYGGIVLAYLYIRYGFHVAVLAHWGIDYLPSVFAFYGQGVFGIPWTSSPGYIIQQVISSDLFGIFGVACVMIVAYIAYTKYRRPDQRQEPPLGHAGSS